MARVGYKLRNKTVLQKEPTEGANERYQELADRLPATMPGAHHNSKYDPVVAAEICRRVSEGDTLSSICKEDGKPDITTFRYWCLAVPELNGVWQAARRLKASSLFDEALDIARQLRDTEYDKGDNATVNARRVAIETLKWAAAKLNPQEYGEKQNSEPLVQINISTPLDLGKTGKIVSAEGREFYSLVAKVPDKVIDVEAKSLPEPQPLKKNGRPRKPKDEEME